MIADASHYPDWPLWGQESYTWACLCMRSDCVECSRLQMDVDYPKYPLDRKDESKKQKKTLRSRGRRNRRTTA